MTSNIDPSLPTENKAYTADVRCNFAEAAVEISALQDTVASLQVQIDSLKTVSAGGTWAWQATPLIAARETLPPVKPTVGLDTDNPVAATTLSVTLADNTGGDFTAAFNMLNTGDGLLLWQQTNSANRMRFGVTGAGAVSGSYFTIPIAVTLIEGVEPINGADVQIQFVFAA